MRLWPGVLLLIVVASACTTEIVPVDTIEGSVAPTESSEPTELRSLDQAFDVGIVEVTSAAGTQDVEVYLAFSSAQRRRGLMGVEDLGRANGMIFVWDAPHIGGFWMKDTLIPLDIAFVGADGLVVAVLEMQPCEEDPCPTYGPDGAAYLMALETAAGSLAIEVGDQIFLVEGSR